MKYLLIKALILLQISVTAQTASNIWLFQLKKDKKVKLIKKITQSDRYENQPSFFNGKIYFTSQNETNTDIRVYDMESGETSFLFKTTTSEYSPSVNLSKSHITTVLVEEDGKQRLWNFPLEGGNPSIALENVEPVGYYTWYGNNKLAMFVLGEPNTLQIADLNNGDTSVEAQDVGRSFIRNPNNPDQFYFIQNGKIDQIMLYSDEGMIEQVPMPENSSDFTISPGGTFFTGEGSILYRFDNKKKMWKKVTDLGSKGVTDISRIAVSEDGSFLALVVMNVD